MKVLITGAHGQLGSELRRTLPAGVEYQGPDRLDLDLADPASIARAIETFRPDWIINAGAYTAVDRAESEAEQAAAINARAPRVLAELAATMRIRLLQLSTDFVFDGDSARPYPIDAEGSPVNVYGTTKWQGETAVRAVCGADALIVRTAWVYSAHGRNFVKSILKAAQEGRPLRVVADQVGSPTWARGLAVALWQMIEMDWRGTWHWTDAGVTSWYDLAVAVGEEAAANGLLPRAPVVIPIASHELPAAARRPSYSVLDKSATWARWPTPPSHWRHQLRLMLQELKDA